MAQSSQYMVQKSPPNVGHWSAGISGCGGGGWGSKIGNLSVMKLGEEGGVLLFFQLFLLPPFLLLLSFFHVSLPSAIIGGGTETPLSILTKWMFNFDHINLDDAASCHVGHKDASINE